jgi:leader peptidase (prepilin peptidase)/N-methyltransferase
MELFAELAPGTYYTFVFAFGAVWGSFLNVVIARLPEGLSVVSPPSRCPRCQKQIAWYDNVPILSWLWLRAKCRGCGLPISARYPLVEALGGLLAVAIAFRVGPTWAALAYFVFALLLLALSFIDLDHFWLPEHLSLPLLGLGLVSPLWNRDLGATLAAYNLVPGPPLLQAFASSWGGALLGAGILWAVGKLGAVLFKKEAMGLGDVVLLAGIGAWLGVQSLFFVVMFASMQGAAVGALMIWRKGRAAAADPVTDSVTGAGTAPEPGTGAVAAPVAESGPVAATANAPAPAPGAAADPPASPPPPAAPVAADPPAAPPAEDDWTPDPHHVPFGPFLALAAIEQLLAGDAIWAGWMGLMNHLWDLIDKLAGRA